MKMPLSGANITKNCCSRMARIRSPYLALSTGSNGGGSDTPPMTVTIVKSPAPRTARKITQNGAPRLCTTVAVAAGARSVEGLLGGSVGGLLEGSVGSGLEG